MITIHRMRFPRVNQPRSLTAPAQDRNQMPQPLHSIETDAILPAATSVVVIGAGVIGISTALCLAERGVAVTVVEKGRVAAEQSSRNWGWCRTTGA